MKFCIAGAVLGEVFLCVNSVALQLAVFEYGHVYASLIVTPAYTLKMMRELHKNAILTGSVDCYCLACERHLWREQDAFRHIDTPIHGFNLAICPYLQIYPKDYIRNVKQGYYCEHCNDLLPTMATVALHVVQNAHMENKSKVAIVRLGDGVLFDNKILISEEVWNGIMDNICAVCNIELEDDVAIHTTKSVHVLNLIRKKLEFAEGGVIYRKVDETSFHCLVCNMIYAITSIDIHINDKKHVQSMQWHENHKKAYVTHSGTQNKIPEINSVKEIGKKEIVMDETSVSVIKSKVSIANNGETAVSNESETEVYDTDDNERKILTPTSIDSTLKTDIADNNLQIKDPIEKHERDTTVKNRDTKNNEHDDKSLSSLDEKHDVNNKQNDILDSVSEFQQKGIKKDFETESAFCRKQFKIIEFDAHDIKNHIEHHQKRDDLGDCVDIPGQSIAMATQKYGCHDEFNREEIGEINSKASYPNEVSYESADELKESEGENFVSPNSTKKDTKKQDKTENPAEFANENEITYNVDNPNAFCRVCAVRMPSSMNNMKEHVLGANHRKNLARVEAEKDVPMYKTTTENFIRDLATVSNFLMNDRDVVINDKYCLSDMSFMMIAERPEGLRCLACVENIRAGRVRRHLESERHTIALSTTPVVYSLALEFVREIRTGIFHCGFCHLIIGEWKDLLQHLACEDHVMKRTFAGLRLNRHRPLIRMHNDNMRRRIADSCNVM